MQILLVFLYLISVFILFADPVPHFSNLQEAQILPEVLDGANVPHVGIIHHRNVVPTDTLLQILAVVVALAAEGWPPSSPW